MTKMPWATGFTEPLPPFSLALHKGAARAVTLHLILTLCLDDEVDIKQLIPKMWQSMRMLKVKDVHFSTLREQTFNNFKLSARGRFDVPRTSFQG
jgi:hypothetical protein